jgi:nitrile hydratase accessory protein
LSQSDPTFQIDSLPRDADGPVFAEPWQAQAFALAVKLSELGYFTWSEWAAALAEELRVSTNREYYESWLAALERLATAKGLTDWAALLDRKEAWAEAYRRTPHGKPIELAAAASQSSKESGGTKWH